MKNNTKQLIMDTAWKHFSKYGYTDTNLERICKEAGITRGPLYYYFADKEDLLDYIDIAFANTSAFNIYIRSNRHKFEKSPIPRMTKAELNELSRQALDSQKSE